MALELKSLEVSPDASLREGIERLDRNATGILIVVDEDERVLGTVTDGDIRRGLLADVDMGDGIMDVANTDPTTVDSGVTDEMALRILNRLKIRHLPVIDDDGRLVGVHLLSDLAERLGGAPALPLTAVIMAGGMGKRLRPLTEDTPKPLIEVGGKPILERILEHLSKSGVERVFITTRYLAEQIEEYFGNGSEWGLHIDYIREVERRGTAGALRLLEDQLDRPFLLMNGDLLTSFNVAEMLAFHSDNDASMTVGLRHFEFEVPYGVAEVDGLKLTQIEEKPTYEFFVNAGVYMLDPALIAQVPRDTYFDITELIDALLDSDSRVLSFPIVERWLDIGRPEDVDKANEKYFRDE